MPELMDLSDIANLLKLSKPYVRDKIVKRSDFPRPALFISQKVKKWSQKDFEEWLEKKRTEW